MIKKNKFDNVRFKGNDRDEKTGRTCHDWKIVGAFSTSHSTISAFPAMSLNSEPGSLDHISVAKWMVTMVRTCMM